MTLQHSLLISPSLSFMASLRTQSWASNHSGPRSLHLSFYAISANSSIAMSLYQSSLGGGWGVTFNCCIIFKLTGKFQKLHKELPYILCRVDSCLPYEGRLETSCPFAPKQFNVHLLKIRMSSCGTVFNFRKIDTVPLYNPQSMLNIIHGPDNVLYSYFFPASDHCCA